jgi:hypothetical protein
VPASAVSWLGQSFDDDQGELSRIQQVSETLLEDIQKSVQVNEKCLCYCDKIGVLTLTVVVTVAAATEGVAG